MKRDTRIETYIQGHNEDTFYAQEMAQDAVIRQLEIIGEAVKRLSDDLRDAHALIPWQDIAGMRDRLAHDYMGVNLGEVWLTAKCDIPTLKAEVMRILEGIGVNQAIQGDM